MLRQKPSPGKPQGANRQIPDLTKARSTFGVSSTSPMQVAGMVTSVRSVTLRRLRRRRLFREHQVHPVARTTKCVLLSERQDHVRGRTAHSSMKQRQQPQQRRQMLKPSPRLRPSRRLNPVLRQRRQPSQRLNLPLLRFECAEHGIH